VSFSASFPDHDQPIPLIIIITTTHHSLPRHDVLASFRVFSRYKAYRDEQARLHAAWREREDARLAAIARGDANPPAAEADPTAEKEIGIWGLVRFVGLVVLGLLLAGKFVTGEWMWGGGAADSLRLGAWVREVRGLWPAQQRFFSEGLLGGFDGSDPGKPIYIAIDGDVYDVSSNRRVYGPGGSYALMAGVDAARAFGTGCFKDHRTHDLRGLSESEIKSVEHWKRFFGDHKSYVRVGRVSHPPIDPSSPLLPHCDPKKDAEQSARWGVVGVPPPGHPAASQAKELKGAAAKVVVEPEPDAKSGSGEKAHEEL